MGFKEIEILKSDKPMSRFVKWLNDQTPEQVVEELSKTHGNIEWRLADRSIFKCRASASGKLMTNARGKDATISKTTISFLREWYKEKLYGHRKELNNKYVNKGLALEDVAIDKVIEWMDLPFAMKNTVRFEDDHFTGEPDLIVDDVIYDTKCSWDCFTFPLFENDLPSKDYFYQMQVYMHLTDCKKAVVCYVLLDSDDDWSDTNYNELGKDLRLKTFEIDYDAEVIEKLIERVEASREYLETIKIK